MAVIIITGSSIGEVNCGQRVETTTTKLNTPRAEGGIAAIAAAFYSLQIDHRPSVVIVAVGITVGRRRADVHLSTRHGIKRRSTRRTLTILSFVRRLSRRHSFDSFRPKQPSHSTPTDGLPTDTKNKNNDTTGFGALEGRESEFVVNRRGSGVGGGGSGGDDRCVSGVAGPVLSHPAAAAPLDV
ncbi:hypothetical protein AGLY_008436 [Aphis glycines]|uniref:Uncharacterized protein n=1 Tax=Aphis glycines TaxID=307491 RepID=A0A6G0TL92_APHGL|nr:hypothetical protein AGLY_008436 [Aphis glycines]